MSPYMRNYQYFVLKYIKSKESSMMNADRSRSKLFRRDDEEPRVIQGDDFLSLKCYCAW